MGLSFADIDVWDPQAVLEVFHAAKSKAEAAQEANDRLGRLPALQTWDGKTAAAAKAAIGKSRIDLQEHSEVALAIADAARNAADEITTVKTELAAIRADAAALPALINEETGAVTPEATSGPEASIAAFEARLLEQAIKTMLANANRADIDLAHVVNMAVGNDAVWPNGGRGGSWYAKSEGPKSEIKGESKLNTRDGLVLSGEASKTGGRYRAGGEWHDKNEDYTASAEASAGTANSASGKAVAGSDGVGVDVEAFGGGKAGVDGFEGTSTLGIGAGVDGRVGLGGNMGAGLLKGDDGSYTVGVKLGGAVGVGGGAHLELKVNPGKVLDKINPFD